MRLEDKSACTSHRSITNIRVIYLTSPYFIGVCRLRARRNTMEISNIFEGTTPRALLMIIHEKMKNVADLGDVWSDKTQLITRFRKMLTFLCENFTEYHSEENLQEILSFFNFKLFFDQYPEYLRVLHVLILKSFCERNSLNENAFNQMKIEHLTEASQEIRVTSNYSVSATVAGGGTNYEVNQQKPATYEIVYMTDHPEIDNFIKYSFILKHNYEIFQKSTHFQKLLMVQLSQYLVKKSNYIMNLYKNLHGTRFRRAGQYILCDYLENFQRVNFKIHTELQKYKITPFLFEMNGKPGIGKSSYVDFLSAFLHQVFPFCDASDMVYNRVNDKFWNGYHQQPIVLYDDQNQNRELRYNLDNEIISLGSGQFVHPPMAFEKETRFSSLFVCFTTNTKLLETTKANKGAIARRIHTYQCEPEESLGTYVTSDLEGEHWQYDEDVIYNPFNILFNGLPFIHNLFDFLRYLTKQRTLQFGQQVISMWYVNSRNVKKVVTLQLLLENYEAVEHNPVQLPKAQQLSALRALSINTKTLTKTSIKKVSDLLNIEHPDVEANMQQLQSFNMKAMLASYSMDSVSKQLKYYSDLVDHFDVPEKRTLKYHELFKQSEEVFMLPGDEKKSLMFRSSPTTIEIYYAYQHYDKTVINYCWIYDVQKRVLYTPVKDLLVGIERDRVKTYVVQMVERWSLAFGRSFSASI